VVEEPIRVKENLVAQPVGFSNTANVDARLMCYKLDIGIGSIAYNAFKKDRKNAEVAAGYTLKLLG